MSSEMQDSAAVMEADRHAALEERADDAGQSIEALSARYAPGTFGCHEALHTAALAMDLVDVNLCAHPAILADAGFYRLAREAHEKLFDLYQAIGAAHLGADGGKG